MRAARTRSPSACAPRIAATNFPRIDGGATISLGVATIMKVTELAGAWDNLVKEADQNLYHAKNEGRNRVASESPLK